MMFRVIWLSVGRAPINCRICLDNCEHMVGDGGGMMVMMVMKVVIMMISDV